MQKDSDLTYLPLLIAVPVAILVVLACYFFIGAVVGTAVLLVAIVGSVVLIARFMRRNDTA
ncbi:MAG: hypothetical protein JST53_15155 [Actinobacteria bacterium]|nr:hypothetical protein [Actinomycetota bacterium]